MVYEENVKYSEISFIIWRLTLSIYLLYNAHLVIFNHI